MLGVSPTARIPLGVSGPVGPGGTEGTLGLAGVSGPAGLGRPARQEKGALPGLQDMVVPLGQLGQDSWATGNLLDPSQNWGRN